MKFEPLTLIKILRRVPHTSAFDRHLTDCAALAVLYSPFGGAEALTVRHVLQLDPLPPFYPEAKHPPELQIIPNETRH
jgi:hypothetical protein